MSIDTIITFARIFFGHVQMADNKFFSCMPYKRGLIILGMSWSRIRIYRDKREYIRHGYLIMLD